MLDFAKISAFKIGQRTSFEEFVCQLARLEQMPERAVFYRIEGAGGDGGIEARWQKPNGDIVGYQAKFFLRSGDIDWSQLDSSVAQAIATYPQLKTYVIALPCDLTARAGAKRKGLSGWDHWESHRAKWEELSQAKLGMTVVFQCWSKSELLARVTAPSAAGLREYFFGDTAIDIDWMKRQAAEAIFALDERYHPEDHVNVRLEKLLSAITRNQDIRDELLSLLEATRRLANEVKKTDSEQPTCSELIEALESTSSIESDLALDPQFLWRTKEWAQILDRVGNATSDLRNTYWQQLKDAVGDSKYRISSQISSLHNLSEKVDEFTSLITSELMNAQASRIAFVRGRAGTGKSHLLAKCTEEALGRGIPAILLLGQRFHNGEVWTQIGERLGLPGRSPEQILGMLDAAGKAAGVRTIIFVDAINEGVGSKYWRGELPNLVQRISQYPFLCCVVSCRSEYFEYAVPRSLQAKNPIFEIRGFESAEEQLNAARVYMDRRGISRPSTPWLAPEFINPLFLRTACLSLAQDGKTEFPPGLTGTRKILQYYLDSLGRTISRREETTVSLTRNVLRSINGIAAEMLSKRQDYLAPDACRFILSQHFQGITPRSHGDWLSVLLSDGVLRTDPNPSETASFEDEEVIRFSFQRFQDFLMAESALENHPNSDTLFRDDGKLAFCLRRDGVIAWQWKGLVDALSVAIPERIGAELVDLLPGGMRNWWGWDTQQAFCESVKWRDHASFSNRTLELLNAYGSSGRDILDLLLQVAVSRDHPWNAMFLHKNLSRRKLADRDATWSIWVNEQSDGPDSSIGILIEWCQIGQAQRTDPTSQYLAGLTLCWMFSSSNRLIRDKATKALVSLFVANLELFPKLIQQFAGTDDLYILERLLSAALGSCCLSPSDKRLKSHSKAIYEHIFKERKPPYGILLRDYALGVVELADFHNVLPDDVSIGCCRPPYISPKPRLIVSEAMLDDIAKRAGDDRIKSSTASFMSDFSRYEIEPRARRFLTIPLSREAPLSRRQLAKAFQKDVVDGRPERVRTYETLANATNPYTSGLLKSSFPAKPKAPSKSAIAAWRKQVEVAESAFLEVISAEDVERFKRDAAPYLYDRDQPKHLSANLDLQSAKRWIAKRAYAYGWTKSRFKSDHGSHYSRERPKIERIGKKYQWLAMDELLSRLSDNFWLDGEYDDLPRVYSGPLDLGFERDIDPTIIDPNAGIQAETDQRWAFQPWIENPLVREEDLRIWPFNKNPASLLKQLPYRIDAAGVRWLVLYEHQSITQKYPEERTGEHGLRLQEFRFLATILVDALQTSEIARYIASKKNLEISWMISDVTDAGFLYESPWRFTWDQATEHYDSWKLPSGRPYSQLVTRYAWESHLDASMPEGFSVHLPAPWLAKSLALSHDKLHKHLWRNEAGEIVFQEIKGAHGDSICLLRADSLQASCFEGKSPMSFLIGERTGWPGGSNSRAAWRRAEGACWGPAEKLKLVTWLEDILN